MRLIDGDELIEHVWRDRLDSRERIANLVKSMPTIKTIPAADVAPVIRCKECKYFMSPHACSHDDGMITAQLDGFCSYGERKE